MKDDQLNFVEKAVVKVLRTIADGLDKADDKYHIYDKMEKHEKKEEEFRKNHPVLNVGKQLAKGTIKGIIGGYTHK